MDNKVKFSVGGYDLAVMRPGVKELQAAQLYYNKALKEALDNKALLRASLEGFMREQNIWNEEKEMVQKRLQREINEAVFKLKKGGMRKSEGKALAIRIRKLRNELSDLIAERNGVFSLSAESQAENARFNALVALCTVYSTEEKSGEKFFKSVDSMLDSAETEVVVEASRCLAGLIYGLDANFETNLPENQFLIRFGYVDDKLRFTNSNGRLVDSEGRLVNEDGRFVDENGNFVDVNGHPVDADGNLLVEEQPFTDD